MNALILHKVGAQWAMAVGSSAVLGRFCELVKLIYRLQNNIAWMLLVPILCLQTSESAGQGLKLIGVTENTPRLLNLRVEHRQLGSICELCVSVVTSAPKVGSAGLNLGTPLIEKSPECNFADSDIPAQQQPMTEITASQRTREDRQNLHGLYQALLPLVAVIGYAIGWWWCDKWDEIRHRGWWFKRPNEKS